jgi:hypothetical protein
MVMVNANGWRVEKVIRTFGDRVRVAGLRVSWRGYWQADCRTTAEVEEYVDLSTLVREASHKYARANVEAPWRSACEQRDALDRATAQSHQLAKTRSNVDCSQPALRVVPDPRRPLGRQTPRAMNSATAHLQNPPPALRSG